MANLNMGDLTVHAHFLLTTSDRTCLAAGFFARSKTKVRAVAASFGKKGGKWNWERFNTESENGWTGIFSPVSMGRDRFTYCLVTNKDIQTRYMLTTRERVHTDFYNLLLNNYKSPLLEWWIPSIIKHLLDNRIIREEYLRRKKETADVVFSLGGNDVSLNDLTCLNLSGLTEEVLEEALSFLLSKKVIWITKEEMEPLQFESFDDYIVNYGHTLVDNLNKEIKPLVPLKANVDTLAIKEKSLFPQQAACINGVLALINAGEKYAVLNEGMGVGKTIQAASAVEAASVEKWLKSHPGKTLRDAYEKPGIVKYRAIIMAPSHLISKWKEEIETEIPYAHATIVKDLSQLVALREAGRKPREKEFYILSKDFSKLDTQISPIPTQIKGKYIALPICTECEEESQKIVYAKGLGSSACCPDCQGTNFRPYSLPYLGKKKGLVCPQCGELLMKYQNYNMENPEIEEILQNSVLRPESFDVHRNSNSVCLHCGASLWGSNAKPLTLPGTTAKVPKWYKISHFKNHAHKGRASAFVLKGYEDRYMAEQVATERTPEGKLTLAGYQVAPSSYGPRKVAPSKYIKKYLKGYFDFCILDEAHKYLGESAQAVAAHALIKASRFSLALTGTIANGTASSPESM